MFLIIEMKTHGIEPLIISQDFNIVAYFLIKMKLLNFKWANKILIQYNTEKMFSIVPESWG